MSLPIRLFNQRLVAILLLGFSSGLPLALTGATLMAWFTKAGVDLKAIGLLTLLGLPYTFKFLWAPLMDYYHFFKKISKRKGWILVTQAGLCILLCVIAHLNPINHTALIGLIAFLIAVFSASQDISINAYTTEILLPHERGLGAAYSVLAYRIALLVSGGLSLILADYYGWRLTYQSMGFLMFALMMMTTCIPDVKASTYQVKNIFINVKLALLDLIKRENFLIIFLFIIFYKFGDALALSLMTNFLLQGLNFTLTEIGLAYKIISIVAVILGGLMGGMLLTRMNLFRALLLFGLMQSFSNLLFVWLAMVGKSFLWMSISVFVENFCSGLSTAALLAFIMSLCNQRYTASQFAFYSALASLGRVLLGPLAAWMVQQVGWTQFYVWSFLLCFPGIFLLTLLKNEGLTHVPATID